MQMYANMICMVIKSSHSVFNLNEVSQKNSIIDNEIPNIERYSSYYFLYDTM